MRDSAPGAFLMGGFSVSHWVLHYSRVPVYFLKQTSLVMPSSLRARSQTNTPLPTEQPTRDPPRIFCLRRMESSAPLPDSVRRVSCPQDCSVRTAAGTASLSWMINNGMHRRPLAAVNAGPAANKRRLGSVAEFAQCSSPHAAAEPGYGRFRSESDHHMHAWLQDAVQLSYPLIGLGCHQSRLFCETMPLS